MEAGAAVVPLLEVPVVDTTGGGDAFVAALTAGLIRGADPDDAARRASAASALSVRRLGGRPALSPAAVEDQLARASR